MSLGPNVENWLRQKYQKRKQNRTKKPPEGYASFRVVIRSKDLPPALAAHRARLEHDVLHARCVQQVREAAAEFDAWVKSEKEKRKRGRGKGAKIKCGSKKPRRKAA